MTSIEDIYIEKYKRDLELFEQVQCIATRYIELPIAFGTENNTLMLRIELTDKIRRHIRKTLRNDIKRYINFLNIPKPDYLEDLYTLKNKTVYTKNIERD